jgi:hypothetical protein
MGVVIINRLDILHFAACRAWKQYFSVIAFFDAFQSFSLAGTQIVGPDCSRITSLTFA